MNRLSKTQILAIFMLISNFKMATNFKMAANFQAGFQNGRQFQNGHKFLNGRQCRQIHWPLMSLCIPHFENQNSATRGHFQLDLEDFGDIL